MRTSKVDATTVRFTPEQLAARKLERRAVEAAIEKTS